MRGSRRLGTGKGCSQMAVFIIIKSRLKNEQTKNRWRGFNNLRFQYCYFAYYTMRVSDSFLPVLLSYTNISNSPTI